MLTIRSLLLSFLLLIAACSEKREEKTEALTVAKAQREIKIGMSSSAVIEALGSPNVITTDEARRETWVYDKISSEVKTNSSSSGAWFLFVGGASSTSSSTTQQKTLTIIVKFDNNNKVRDFSYRNSSF